MNAQNFGFAILRHALAQPDAPALVGRHGTFDYRQLGDLVVHFAFRMRSVGVCQGSTVGIAIYNPSTAAIAVAALSLLGAGWLIVLDDSTIGAFPGEVSHVFAAGSNRPSHWHTIDSDWFTAPPAPDGVEGDFAGQSSPDATWTFASSSGTTGRPKTMPISYGTVWQRSVRPELRDTQPHVLANLFSPITHVGIRCSLCNLAFGGANVGMGQWTDLVAAGVTRVLGSPSHISSMFGRNEVPERRIPVCRITGASVTGRLVEMALDYFDEVEVLYGSTEAGTMALGRFSATDPYDGSVGTPPADVEVQAIGPRGTLLPAGVEGVLRVRTGTLIPGYLGHVESDSQPIRDGWFHPGDLGFIDANGAVHITGRADDVINTGGNKINAVDIDAIIEAHPDVVDGFCFIEKDEFGHGVLAAIVVLREGAGTDNLKSIKTEVLARLHHVIWPRHLYIAGQVPRSASGKVMRNQAAELARDLSRVDLP